MKLDLMYITNIPEIAMIAEKCGTDIIFVDLEILGKYDRQGHLDTVISHHNISDIEPIASVLTKSKLLVRVNPINENSSKEINEVIEKGADIIMLPFFKTVDEVKEFIHYVDSRVETMLLLETPEAVSCINEIVSVKGIDSIHIGLNDLHLGYEMKFMFELISNGIVEQLCKVIDRANIKYGFGGIAKLGSGKISAENIILEHMRMNSTQVILSRSFSNTINFNNNDDFENDFRDQMIKLSNFISSNNRLTESILEVNFEQIKVKVKEIVENLDV